MAPVTVLLAVSLVVGCSGSGQELAPTQPPVVTSTVASTTTTQPATTSSVEGGTTTTVPPTTTTTLAPLRSLAYEEVAAVEFPIQLVPRDYTTSLLATKDGQLYWFHDGALDTEPALDISSKVVNKGERGLLSIAVHPLDDGRLFAHYSAAEDGDTVVEEYAITDDKTIDPEPVRRLLRLDQPAGNHNGGMLQFDSTGEHLFLGLGDGGAADDKFGNGQNTDTLLAGLVRFDVDSSSPGEVSEPILWQYGLRNPWRFSIDDDLVYIADVGQNTFEEVSVADIGVEGTNYGWSVTEGLHCFHPSSGCDTSGITLPVIEVSHGDGGTCSITGGYVYRGSAIPELTGHFLYSDYCGGYLRSFKYEGGEAVEQTDWTDQVGVPGQVVSFGMDNEDEVYVLTTASVLRLVPVRDE